MFKNNQGINHFIQETFINDYDALAPKQKESLPSQLKTAIQAYKKQPNTSSIRNLFAIAVKTLPQQQQKFPFLAQLLQSDLMYVYNMNDEVRFRMIIEHKEPLIIAYALKVIQTQEDSGCFSPAWGKQISSFLNKHPKPLEFIQALLLLSEKGEIFAQQGLLNLDVLAQHQNPRRLAEVFLTLDSEGLLTATNAEALHEHPNPWELNYAFRLLKEAQAPTEVIQNDPLYTAILQQEKLLTLPNVKNLIQHPNLTSVNAALELIIATKALSPSLPPSSLFDFYGINDSYHLCIYHTSAKLSPPPEPTLATYTAGAANVVAVIQHRSSPLIIAKILSEIMNSAGLLIGKNGPKNRKVITQETHSVQFYHALLHLKTAGLLEPRCAQGNFDLLSTAHQNSQKQSKKLEFFRAIAHLTENTLLLTQVTFEALAKHQNPENLACALKIPGIQALANNILKLLYQEQANPFILATALMALHQSGLLNKLSNTYINQIAMHPDPSNVSNGLISLYQTGHAEDQYLQLMFKHKNPSAISIILSLLHETSALTGANIKTLMSHPFPDTLQSLLFTLKRHGLLRSEKSCINFTHAATCQTSGAKYLNNAISLLNKEGLLSQINFERFIEHASILLGTEASGKLWTEVTKLTSAQFEKIMTLCKQHSNNPASGITAFTKYAQDELLHRPGQALQATSVFNTATSFQKTEEYHTPPIPDSAMALSPKPSSFFPFEP